VDGEGVTGGDHRVVDTGDQGGESRPGIGVDRQLATVVIDAEATLTITGYLDDVPGTCREFGALESGIEPIDLLGQ
jgi:hypothetical protein